MSARPAQTVVVSRPAQAPAQSQAPTTANTSRPSGPPPAYSQQQAGPTRSYAIAQAKAIFAEGLKKRSTLIITLFFGTILPLGVVQTIFCLLLHYKLTPLTTPKPYAPTAADGMITADYDGIWHRCGPGVMWVLLGITVAIGIFFGALWALLRKKDGDGDPAVSEWKVEKTGKIAGGLSFLVFLLVIASLFGYVHLVVDGF